MGMENPRAIHSFKAHLPAHGLEQRQILEWIKKAHIQAESLKSQPDTDLPLERLVDRYAIKDNLIERRKFECDDLYNEKWEDNEVYRLDQEHPEGLGIEHRQMFFQRRANQVFDELFPPAIQPPHHLIHVTCTGYVAPSAAQMLISRRGWTNTEVTHAYHMGCYASLPSIRLAQGLSVHSGESVTVVHTEMCSLHMNPASHDPEQVVMQTLFADGHMKYQVGALPTGEVGLEVVRIKERIVPETGLDMTWLPSSWGMRMSLSRDVPVKLKSVVRDFYTDLVRECGLDPDAILRSADFAVHPGGPKIIDAVQEELQLSDEQLIASRKILRERGNMSSATLPHVWEELLRTPVQGKYVVSLAFGPGLTIFGAIFKMRM